MHHQSIDTSRGHHVGAMTATMRALAAGPRALRVALVLGGRIVEERRVRAGSGLTIGSSEHADLVVPSASLPGRFLLFEAAGDGFRLLPPRGSQGRVALRSGVEELRGRPITLDESTRGKIDLGDATLLFQVVLEPPARAKPRLPHAVLEPAVRIDWSTSVIAAFSFLLHFLFAGALYSEWLDPVLDQALTVNGLVDAVRSLPHPPRVEPPAADQQTTGAKPTAAPKPNPSPGGADKPTGRGGVGSSGRAGLTHDLAALELAVLGGLTSGRPATWDVLRQSEVPTTALDEAARSAVGVSGPGRISISKGGPVAQGANDLSNLVRRDVIDVHETGRVQTLSGPRTSVSPGQPTVHGTVSDASRVVAAMRPGFRACYQRAIAEYPDAQGRVFLRVFVGANGEVTSVAASPSGNVPASMVSCVRSRAGASRFEPPEGGAAVVEIPADFILR